jgi:hypothetical protein
MNSRTPEQKKHFFRILGWRKRDDAGEAEQQPPPSEPDPSPMEWRCPHCNRPEQKITTCAHCGYVYPDEEVDWMAIIAILALIGIAGICIFFFWDWAFLSDETISETTIRWAHDINDIMERLK